MSDTATAAVEKYRTITEELHIAHGAWASTAARLDRVRAEVHQSGIRRQRLAAPRHGKSEDRSAQAAELAEHDAAARPAVEELNRLEAAIAPLQARRDLANGTACRCRDVMLERGLISRSDAGF